MRTLQSLVVDDDPTSALVLARLLSPFGPADLVHTGLKALTLAKAQVARNESYDLICLDVGLPDVSGVELLRAIRTIEECHNRAPGRGASAIVMVTGDTRSDVIFTAFRDQADGYLAKPVRKDDVMGVLRDLRLWPRAAVAGR